jgi:hypothetical protein
MGPPPPFGLAHARVQNAPVSARLLERARRLHLAPPELDHLLLHRTYERSEAVEPRRHPIAVGGGRDQVPGGRLPRAEPRALRLDRAFVTGQLVAPRLDRLPEPRFSPLDPVAGLRELPGCVIHLVATEGGKDAQGIAGSHGRKVTQPAPVGDFATTWTSRGAMPPSVPLPDWRGDILVSPCRPGSDCAGPEPC